RDGSGQAVATAEYRTDGGKVRSLKAWIVPPSGPARQLSNKASVDLSLAGNDMVNEARAISLSGEDDAVPGSTFAWETLVERRAAFAQFEWYFQDGLPTLKSEFTFRPQPGWSVRAAMMNADSLAPRVADGLWTWSRAELGAIPNEAYSPPLSSLAARLVVGASPPPGSPPETMRTFGDWAEVSAWLHQAAEPNGLPTPAIEAKARQVTSRAATTNEKIRAVAEYCQSVNYISIQMGLSRGGGYIPHAADEVLRRGYGDCKDKSNLMRAMLRSLGIESYLCAISAFDPDYVTPSWPTPGQFNHCIVAARSDDSAACAIESPSLGRLVLFDPTDIATRWGSLPDPEQGGLALLIAPAGGALIRVPVAPPDRGRHRRRYEASVAPDGSIAGRVEIVASGSSAAMWRMRSRERGSAGLANAPDLWLCSAVATAAVDSFAQSDPPDDDRYRIRAAFRIPKFGRTMGGRLIILETGRLTTMEVTLPSQASRSLPMRIPRFAGSDIVRLTLPPGYALEGTPAPVAIEGPYGRYTATVRVEGDEVAIERVTELPRSIVPAAKSAEVRDFLLRVKRALDTPLVLAKK
ncbi:MAG TPA: transglutaminase domain-containing protein, partial [Candidatus Eisenbacteria bacterium]|nr:transglutaminase domain-containing protein [Candidatus Eisenbacteria bacterium]